VEFEIGDDVTVNGQILIQSGTAVRGSLLQVDHPDKGQARVLIDLGPAQTVSGESVALAWTPLPFSGNGSGVADVIGWGAETGPILPALVIASLFEKKVFLPKDAWVLARAKGSVALDAEKQKAEQEQYIANRKAAQAEPCSLVPESRKADLLHQAGDLDGAIEVYEQMLTSRVNFPCSRDPLLSLFYPTASLHFMVAGLFREKGDFAHAVAECRTALQLDPQDERFRTGLVNTLEDSGDLDGALAEIKDAIQKGPERPYFHYLLGRVLVRKNDPDTAIVELELALKELKNHLSPANCELGRAFELKGDRQAALRQYRTAFRAHVNDEQCRAAYERLKLQPKK
jgi:tetratricopeptide (TPR) repeat protein